MARRARSTPSPPCCRSGAKPRLQGAWRGWRHGHRALVSALLPGSRFDPESFDLPAEEPVDARRYIEALRSRAGWIVGAAVAVAVLVLVISLALPKSYNAVAQIAPSAEATTTAAAASSSTAEENLATIEAYITSPAVLTAAAHSVGGESMSSLSKKITTSLDPNANIVSVTASDSNGRRAAQLANGVAETFLSVRAAAQQAQLAQQIKLLSAQLASARATGSPGLAAALATQISSLAAQEASAGSDLQLLAPAQVPRSASSPRPVRNTVISFIAALFLGVLLVGGRELLAPRISSGRELSAVMGLPILGRVPRNPNGRWNRRRSVSSAEGEAYRFVARSVELAMPPRRPCLVAVTSAIRSEGKTTVVSRLGAALAESGRKTLLVSADLHWPTLHETFGLPIGTSLLRSVKRVQGNLYVLTSGPPPQDPTAILTEAKVGAVLERIRKLDYDYVLIDLPPLLAVAEAQLFVRLADATVLTSFAGRTTTEQLAQTRELLDRLGVEPAGIVVLGVRREDAPLTYGRRFSVVPEAGESA